MSDEFITEIQDALSDFGAIHTRKMFGGYGVYHQGIMFALVADGELYLKANEATAKQFQSCGLGPFTYVKNGKAMKMSYYQAPADFFEDKVSARQWALLAFDVAYEQSQKKRKQAL